MHSTQNFNQEQGRFRTKRPVELYSVESSSAGAETGTEKLGVRAALQELSKSIGIETPMKQMMAIERTLAQEGETEEFIFENEKVMATKRGERVVWKTEDGREILKAQWLKPLADKAKNATKEFRNT